MRISFIYSPFLLFLLGSGVWGRVCADGVPAFSGMELLPPPVGDAHGHDDLARRSWTLTALRCSSGWRNLFRTDYRGLCSKGFRRWLAKSCRAGWVHTNIVGWHGLCRRIGRLCRDGMSTCGQDVDPRTARAQLS